MTTYWICVLGNLKIAVGFVLIFFSIFGSAFTLTSLIIEDKLPDKFSQGVLVLFVCLIIYILIPDQDVLIDLILR